MIYAIVGLLFLLADQFLKFWTVAHVELNAYPGIELIPGVLNLTYIKNTGIAFGLFGDKPMLRWILLALLAAFTVFIVASMATRYLRTGFARWTGVLLLTGLLGNGVDRAVYGYVVDMLEPKLGSISWPIFNIADALILVFGILFCIALLSGGFGAPKRKRRKAPLRRDDRASARKPRPEAARGASSGKSRRPHEGARPARRSEPAAARPAERKQAAASSDEDEGRPTPARAAETLRRSGIAVRPAEESEPAAPVRTEESAPSPESAPKESAPVSAPEPEEPEVRVVERPAPKTEPQEPAPEKKPASSIEDLDLDSILAEFK